MKTLLGNEIPETIKGIVYLCDFDHDKLVITTIAEIMCEQASIALNLYAEIPNPASQLAMGGTHHEFCKELERLHHNMKDRTWLKNLSECL
jgi:hypothetical protein